ncbi:MAG: hypothetical protein ACKODK_05195 [Opitutaceae bacterium]
MRTSPQRFGSNQTASRGPASGGGSAPVKTLRLGRRKAAVWENSADGRTYHNVKFARTYLDENKKFQDTDTFGREDLLLLAKLADQVHTLICERQAAQRSDEAAPA